MLTRKQVDMFIRDELEAIRNYGGLAKRHIAFYQLYQDEVRHLRILEHLKKLIR